MVNYCRKTRFGTEKDAQFHLDKMRETSNREVFPTRAYLCENCNMWHVTSLSTDDEKTNAELRKTVSSKNMIIKKLYKRIEKLEGRRSFRRKN